MKQTPSEFLKNTIYPDLDQALIELIQRISNTDEIIRHQERLIEQKQLDKFEQKKIEKEKLKKELGSAYESSEESGSEEELKKSNINANDVELNPIKYNEEEIRNEEESEKNLQAKEDNFNTKKNKFGMIVIEEGDEGEDFEGNPKRVEMDEETRYEMELEKKRREFNPVKFLGECLKRMAESKNKS